MGLDMWLFRTKRIGNVTIKELDNVDAYLSYINRGDKFKECTLKDWCGLDIEQVNMDMLEDYKNEYQCNSIWEEVAYWRKANQIHGWFIDVVQDGEDDCKTYEVDKRQLEYLLDACNQVLDGCKNDNFEIAEELLPVKCGFFFGSYEYDDWYVKNVRYTKNVLEEILDTTDFENEIVVYSSSW